MTRLQDPLKEFSISIININSHHSLKAFYKGKKVFVTGHTGFKGSWLTRILLMLGAEVCGYALKPETEPSLFKDLKLKKQIDNHFADIRDLEKLCDAIEKFKPDIVFHMAAQPLVRGSYKDPRYTYDVNIMGTVNILEAIRLNNIKAGVLITTDKVYKNKEKNIAYTEDDELGGYDPYSTSKACDELIIRSYIDSFFNPKDFKIKHNTQIASARAGNVIGGGDWSEDRLIPDIVKSVFLQKELTIRNPDSVRPWQHVLEPLAGYLLLAKELYEGRPKTGAWNFGPEHAEGSIKVKDITALSIRIMGKGSYKIQKDTGMHEAVLLSLDIGKAKQNLRWKPVFDTETAIRKTFDWYRNYYTAPETIGTFTANQINKYFDSL